jgi:hypothetical protein
LVLRIAGKGNDVVAAADERMAQGAADEAACSGDGDMSWHTNSVF